jgi:hypothetical protein
VETWQRCLVHLTTTVYTDSSLCQVCGNLAEGGVPDFPSIILRVVKPARNADDNGQPYGQVDDVELKFLHVSDPFRYLFFFNDFFCNIFFNLEIKTPPRLRCTSLPLKTNYNTIIRMEKQLYSDITVVNSSTPPMRFATFKNKSQYHLI